MWQIEELKVVLKEHLKWNGARISFWAMFLWALIKVKTINLAQIAAVFNPVYFLRNDILQIQRRNF